MEELLTLTEIEKKLIKDFRKKLKKGRLLKCQNTKCNHYWIYLGKKKDGYTSCPKCFHPVHVERHRFEEEKQ